METIGDAYMVVSGVPERSMYHAEHVADLALDMIAAMPTLSDPSKSSEYLKIRIGKEMFAVKFSLINCTIIYIFSQVTCNKANGLKPGVTVKPTRVTYLGDAMQMQCKCNANTREGVGSINNNNSDPLILGKM